MPKNRMHPGLVALSASAVAAIYVAGYVRTQSADAAIDTPAAAPTAVVAAAPPLTAPPTVVPVAPPQGRQPSIPTARPTPARQAAAPPSSQQAATYKDGTYTGQGSSRRGDVSVSVAVSGGRITSVNITRSTLQYPLRVISNLPDEVVQRQSPQVDVVSRATYSSQAFRQAVAQALQKAV